MKTRNSLALAALAGISIGAVSVIEVHPPEAKAPHPCPIADPDGTGRAASQKHGDKVRETPAPFTGSFHSTVPGGKAQALAWYNPPPCEAFRRVP